MSVPRRMGDGAAIRSVAIIGAGNGGCAAAADLTARGFEVRLYGRSESTVAPMRARGGIAYEGVLGEGFAPLPLVTTDAGEAMEGADLVLIMGPTQAHEAIARTIAPHLAPGQILMAAPGHTLLLIPNAVRAAGGRLRVYCDSATLPYICRKSAPDRVRITRAARTMLFAVYPAVDTEMVAARIKPVLPAIEPRPSLLHTVFPYTNAIHHPAALLLNVGRVESTGGDYCHYYDGITPGVGRLIDALDRERLAVAQAFGVTVEALPDYFFRLGYTDAEGKAGGGAYSTFHHSEPNRWIKAPSTIDHRFFNEDVPYGLVAIAELGRLASVATPQADAVIAIASTVAARDFRAEGLTLDRMGIAGLAASELGHLLETGGV